MSITPPPQGLEQSNPKLARIIKDDDIAGLQEELRRVKGMQDAHNSALQREQELLEADPFDPDVQKRIEELIQAKNIEENFAAALEHTPEVRGSVWWLGRWCGCGCWCWGVSIYWWCCWWLWWWVVLVVVRLVLQVRVQVWVLCALNVQGGSVDAMHC